MATLAFDSLQFARRLKAVGVPEKQAEVQAELMAEAFGFYAENIVTRDYLDATLRASFAEQDARWDKKLAARDAARSLDLAMMKLEATMDRGFDDLTRRMRWLIFMVGVTWVLLSLRLLQDMPWS